MCQTHEGLPAKMEADPGSLRMGNHEPWTSGCQEGGCLTALMPRAIFVVLAC